MTTQQFIHSPIGGPWDVSVFFTVMNTVVMNILFKVLLWTYAFILDKYRGLELLGCKANTCLLS